MTFPAWVVWSKRLSEDKSINIPANSVAINIVETARSIQVTYDELMAAAGLEKGSFQGGVVLEDMGVWSGKATPSVSAGGKWSFGAKGRAESEWVVFLPKQ